MKTKITTCVCAHPGQDELHGKGLRVHNECKALASSNTAFRCTVCGSKHEKSK